MKNERIRPEKQENPRNEKILRAVRDALLIVWCTNAIYGKKPRVSTLLHLISLGSKQRIPSFHLDAPTCALRKTESYALKTL